MKRYFVKMTCTAKDNNPNFAGEVGVYYCGKGGELIKTEGTHLSDKNRDWMSLKGMEFGYKRECDAKRSWVYRNPNAFKNSYWEESVEIVEMEV